MPVHVSTPKPVSSATPPRQPKGALTPTRHEAGEAGWIYITEGNPDGVRGGSRPWTQRRLTKSVGCTCSTMAWLIPCMLSSFPKVGWILRCIKYVTLSGRECWTATMKMTSPKTWSEYLLDFFLTRPILVTSYENSGVKTTYNELPKTIKYKKKDKDKI